MPHRRDLGPREEPPRLQPVLSDEPIVASQLARRLRIFLVALTLAVVLVNVTAYVIVVGVARDINRDRAELRRQRDAQLARQEQEQARTREAVARMRELVCVIVDRLPRDETVEQVRSEFGC